MPLLVLFRRDDGQIISATRVNKNHSAGNFPPKIQRLIKYAETLKLRYILVDDKITPSSHQVQEASTGFSIVRKEEANPLWLEPLLTLTGDPELAARPEPSVHVRYVTPAAANPQYIKLQPGITIFVPLRARWYCGVDFFDALIKLKKPEGVPVSLVLYNNSLDPTFGGLCKWFLAGVEGFANTLYVNDETEPAKGGKETVEAVARIYGRMTHLVDTEYILTIEDDVVALDEDVLVNLYGVLSNSEKAAAAAANVVERNDYRTMCWTLRGDIPTIQYAMRLDAIQQVDAVSFSCTLWQTRLLKMCAVRPLQRHEHSFFATDITLCKDLFDLGYHCLMCWDIRCAHVEPWYQLEPNLGDPRFLKRKRSPSSRREVSETIAQSISLPAPSRQKSFIGGIVDWFTPKVSVGTIKELVVLHVQEEPTRQFLTNLSQIKFSEETAVVIYGAVRQSQFPNISAHFVDDWNVLAPIIKSAYRILWWDSRVIIHPVGVQALLDAEGLTLVDLPSSDLAVATFERIAEVWACDRGQLPDKIDNFEAVASSIFEHEKKVFHVEGSRWFSESGKWQPVEGYRPGELVSAPKVALTYYGDQVTDDEKEWPLDVSIAMACFNGPEMTDNAIQSLLDTTEHLKREIMVWDNASTDPKVEDMLAKWQTHPSVQVFRSPVNRGYIYPNNLMSKRAKGKFLVVSNNDLVVHPGWFEALQKPFDEDSMVAQTGPPPEYGHLSEDFLGGPGEGNPDYLEGFFFMLPRWVLNRHLVFNEQELVFATCEDADLSLRLREMGYRIVVCSGAKVDHLRSVTRASDNDIRKRMDESEERNRIYMLGRWGNYLRTRRFLKHKILVNRKGANGDLLSCEGALKGLRWKYPNSHITLVTECVEIIRDCPWVDEVRFEPERGVEYNLAHNLDGIYEEDLGQNRPRIVSNALGVPFARPGYWVTERAQERVAEQFNGERPIIAIHFAASWSNRCWPSDRWLTLIGRLSRDFRVIVLGDAKDERLGIGETFYNRPWQEVASLCRLSKVVVCTDSSILHIAAGVQTTTVCIFGPTDPKLVYDSPYIIPVKVDNLDCLGCHHKPPFPKTVSSCSQPQHYCMQGLAVCTVYGAVLKAAGVEGDCEE